MHGVHGSRYPWVVHRFGVSHGRCIRLINASCSRFAPLWLTNIGEGVAKDALEDGRGGVHLLRCGGMGQLGKDASQQGNGGRMVRGPVAQMWAELAGVQ